MTKVRDLKRKLERQARRDSCRHKITEIADLVPDHMELARSAHLEDKQLFFLQCAMEENCLAQSAVKAQVTLLETSIISV